MTITQTSLERFHALPTHIQAAVLEKHHDINVGDWHDWWASVYEDFKDKCLNEYGIDVIKMYFSGFWSQGDGACFEGRVCNWYQFLGKCGYNDRVLERHAEREFCFSCEHYGHYYHSYSVRFASDLPLPEHDEDNDFTEQYLDYLPGELHSSVALACLNKYDAYKLYADFRQMFHDLMDELYEMLEAEYEYLTSEAAILETLDCNDQLDNAINDAIEEFDHA